MDILKPLRSKTMAALGLLAASSAAQAGLIGVSTIEVTNSAGGSYLQVSEVFAFETGTGNDLALSSAGATASGTSYWPTTCNGTNTAACAIDGVGPSAWNNIYHGGNMTGDTLTINLASPSELDVIAISGRTDCCSDRDLFTVTLLDVQGAQLFTADLDARSGTARVALPDTSVPVPATLGLFALGALGLRVGARRRA